MVDIATDIATSTPLYSNYIMMHLDLTHRHSGQRAPSRGRALFLALLILIPTSHLSATAGSSPKKPVGKSEKRVSTKKASAKKPKTDYNQLGMKAFAKGDFKTALGHFEQSMQKEPKNPLGFIHHARTLIALSRGRDPEDYCALEKNWVLSALSSLSKAAQIDRKLVATQMDRFKESTFLEFKRRPEFKKWLPTLTPPLVSDDSIKKFILARPEWLAREDGMPPTIVTLRSDFSAKVQKADGESSEGKWTAEKGEVSIDTQIISGVFSIKTVPYFLGQTRNFILNIALVDKAKRFELPLGPVTDDCP